MARYFVPFSHNLPHSVVVNGHKLVILSTNKGDFIKHYRRMGADDLREITVEGSTDASELARLAATVNSSVVLTPPGMSLDFMLESLHEQLPWVH